MKRQIKNLLQVYFPQIDERDEGPDRDNPTLPMTREEQGDSMNVFEEDIFVSKSFSIFLLQSVQKL